jgi:DUF1680 family protein
VRLTLRPGAPRRFDLQVRVPGWCRKWSVRVNGRCVPCKAVRGYARVARCWADGDVVDLAFDMPVESVAAHPAVAEDLGRVALQRGPLVYCVEACDTPAVRELLLPRRAALRARWDARRLGGVMVIEGAARAVEPAAWKGRLYRRAQERRTQRTKLTAVPYFAWDNRKPGAMAVWLPVV